MKKIIITIFVISLMLMFSGISVNAINKGESPTELMIEGNVLITEFFNNRTIEVDIAGDIVWEKSGLGAPHDAERLSNGNTLITVYGEQIVIEVDSTGDIVWQQTGLNMPMDSERLSNGNTLITEYGGDRVIEIDSAGDIVWDVSGLNDPFDAERLPNGNTLIAETPMSNGRIIEIDSAGDLVWEKAGLSAPVDVERLPNGNTLITEHIGGSVIEVDSAGAIVWAKTGLHVPKDAERLPNGNTLIADCGANRTIEVDYAGDIVWEKSGVYYPTDVESLFNYPPYPPEIDGPPTGSPKTEYEYNFSAIDPNDHDVKYYVDWDDGTTDETTYYGSGEVVTLGHTWDKKDTYIIKAKAEDIFGESSNWTEFEVNIPRNRAYNYNPIEWLFERFPHAFPILRYLLILQ